MAAAVARPVRVTSPTPPSRSDGPGVVPDGPPQASPAARRPRVSITAPSPPPPPPPPKTHRATASTGSAGVGRSASASAASAAPPKTFKNMFRSSLQETLRHVSGSSPRKPSKSGDDSNTHSPSPPPSSFLRRPVAALRRSLDSSATPEKQKAAAPPGTKQRTSSDAVRRRSFDALTQSSLAGSSVGSQSSGRSEGGGGGEGGSRPRVLRKGESRKRRPGTPDSGRLLSSSPPPIPPSPPPSPDPPAHPRAEGWAPFVFPTLSKGSMSSPHLTLGRSASPEVDHHPSPHLQQKQPQQQPLSRRQRSPLSSFGALFAPPRTRRQSDAAAVVTTNPSTSRSSEAPSPPKPSSSSPARPTRARPPPLTISRPKAMLPASPSSPTLVPPKRTGPASPPAAAAPNGRTPSPSVAGRASPSTPKASRVIGMGHPSTRRNAFSSSHLPLPADRSSSPSTALSPSPTPSTPTTPTPRTRCPTASTAASRARATSPITIRAASPASPTRSISPTSRSLTPSNPAAHRRLGSAGPASASTSNLSFSPSTSSPGRLVPRHGHSSSVPVARISPPSPTTASTERNIIHRAAATLVRELVNRRSAVPPDVWEGVERRMNALARLERVWPTSNEERERQVFADALRDGYVLCQFINQLRPGSIKRVDESGRDSGKAANIARFLAVAAHQGVQLAELFDPQDLEASDARSLARVAHTVLVLVDLPQTRVYGNGVAGSSASTPNLVGRRSTSPAAIGVPLSGRRQQPQLQQKRWSPPAPALPTVRSVSPAEERDSASPLPRPPRPRQEYDDEAGDVFGPIEFPDSPESMIATTSTTASPTLPTRVPRMSATSRVSLASSSAASTATTTYSSLLDQRATRFGTVRTVTTDATTTGPPSFSRTEGSRAVALFLAEEEAAAAAAEEAPWDEDASSPMRTRTSAPLSPSSPSQPLSSSPARRQIVDLSRVAEESVEEVPQPSPPSRPPRSPARGGVIQLGKGKWPEDYFPALSHAADDKEASPASSPVLDPGMGGVGGVRARRRSSRTSSEMLLPRPEVLMAEQLDRERQPSPAESRDSSTPSPGGATGKTRVRRSSGRAVYIPRTGSEERVPFPAATATGESPKRGNGLEHLAHARVRHRSELEQPRRSSFGDARDRARFESMVNLGGGRGESSSDAGSGVKKTLIVKEEGKPAMHYQLGNCIGRGQFGSVYRALNLNTGQTVAVKCIRLEGLAEDEVAKLMHEVEVVKRLSHPSIVKYEGMVRDADTLNIVLEYAENGSLAQTLKAFGKLNEKLVAHYVIRVLEGLHYLHTSQVVHCDLKAANILTTKTANVKLSDFGVSLVLNLRALDQNDVVAGTPNWMAPEVIELKGAQPASDIWSLACTIIELLTGRPPYADIQNSMAVMYRIVEGGGPPIPEGLSEPLQDFLKQCFNKDPKQRPSAERMFEHPWLKLDGDLYQELRPQDSIPFLRRVSADFQRSDVRLLTFVDDDGLPSPRLSNGGFERSSDPVTPRPHTFVKSTFGQPMTCKVCSLPIKRNAMFCTECSLIAHPKCTIDAPDTCDLRAQVIRLSHDLQREVVLRQQQQQQQQQQSASPNGNSPASPTGTPPLKPADSPNSSPTAATTTTATTPAVPAASGSPTSPTSTSPPPVFRLFTRKKSKASSFVSSSTDMSAAPPATTTTTATPPAPPPKHNEGEPTTTRRGLFASRSRNNLDDVSRSRTSVATASCQTPSTRSAATAAGAAGGGSVSSRNAADEDTPLIMDDAALMNARGHEAFARRRGAAAATQQQQQRRENRESHTSRSGCTVQ